MARFLPVYTRGDSNIQIRGIASTIRNMVNRVQPTVMPLICAQFPSVRAYEQLVHISAVPKPRKWDKTERVGGVIGTLLQTVNNDTYEVSLGINGDDFKDDQIGAYAPLAAELAKSLILYPDELVTTNLVANGTAVTCFDTQNFYATTHTWPNAQNTTNNSNLSTASGTAGDQIENDFYAAKQKMATWFDDRSRLRVPPQEIEGAGCLAIHFPAGSALLAQNMNRVFGMTPGGDAYDINISGSATKRVSALAGKALLIPDGYLTGTSWYMHNIGGMFPERPFAFLDREAPYVQIFGPGSEHFEKYNEVLILGRRRFGLGVLRPERSQKMT